MIIGLELPKEVQLSEVGPRDGFQSEHEFIPTKKKIDIINALSETGLKRIEVTSFVHPKTIPQLKDAEKVMEGIKRQAGVIYAALVPNVYGAKRAVEAGVDEIVTVMSATETHNKHNVNMTMEESLDNLSSIAEIVNSISTKIMMACGISVTFGCPYEGAVPVERILDIVERLQKMGVRKIGFGDPIGIANPKQVYNLSYRLVTNWPDLGFGMHFHVTRGMAMANVFAAMEAGINHFDTSVAGLGGSPFSPGSLGNIATEDLVYMLDQLGISHHIRWNAILRIAEQMEKLLKRRANSYSIRAIKAGVQLNR